MYRGLRLVQTTSNGFRFLRQPSRPKAPRPVAKSGSYRDRNAIERMFGRIKDFRRIATRYDKLARNFLAAVCLVATVCYWL